jgi:hypothetical protein
LELLSKSKTLRNKHKGSKFLVCGNAPSLGDVDLLIPPGVVTIGANRILNHPYFVPDYLMLCDRLPYSIDLKKGLYHEYENDVTYLVSTTLYDPTIKCRGFPVVPKPDFRFFPWRVGTMGTDINITTMEEKLCSFGTIAGPMIQAAIIMGASEVGVVGVDLVAPITGTMHFYKEGKGEELRGKEGAIDGKKDISPRGCLDRFSKLRCVASKAGVTITNLSPVKDSPFASVFPSHDFDEWISNA